MHPSELDIARLRKNYSSDPLLELYIYVFQKSLDSEYCNSPHLVDPKLAKAIVYETLKLVIEFYNSEHLSSDNKE